MIWYRIWQSLEIGITILIAVLTVLTVRWWWRGFCGLDQMPNPYGRYYKEWLKLPESAENYYEWLAQKMESREPWHTWAEMHKHVKVRSWK